MWVAVPLNMRHSALYYLYRKHLWCEGLNFHGKDVGGILLLGFQQYSFGLLVFPLTIVTLALWEFRNGTVARRLAFLGNISYASYLLHFPLQMVFVGITFSFAIPYTFYYTPWSMILFFMILIPLSLCSYSFIERPCQSLIRIWASRNWPLSKDAGPDPS
jgi:peptidoglycan/LPS O-acetylase OafA/YrhL